MSAKTEDKKNCINFSVASFAAWAPGIETEAAWQAWANNELTITRDKVPAVKLMPAMLRRRLSTAGKMALEVAYRCLDDQASIPIIFCSRHGECERSVELLTDLAQNVQLSPTAFSLSVHNAAAGLFSIARQEHANNIAIAASHSTIEHAVIEACGLIADGVPAVLLVAYDIALPAIFSAFQDCHEQPYAWAWLIQPATQNTISLTWSATHQASTLENMHESAGLEILRFFLRKHSPLERICNGRIWQWSHHA